MGLKPWHKSSGSVSSKGHVAHRNRFTKVAGLVGYRLEVRGRAASLQGNGVGKPCLDLHL